ncbi:MAG TPA: hypothetical protein VGN19_08975 [Pedococcus sp.]|jgi:plastocyanin|nr:hypothetical protein [Pedococcus sp.]
MTKSRYVATVVGVLAALTLGACGGTPGASPAGPSAKATGTNLRVIRVTIHGKDVSPSPGDVQVPLGTTVRLVVTSDHEDELHAHGFEVERTLKAGSPTTLDLNAANPGVYEIETHHPPLTLMRLVIR